MDKNKQREAFEAAWLKRTGFAPVRAAYGDGYYYSDQQSAWWAWQEALASIEIELPESYDDGHGNEWLPKDSTINLITSRGIRVKGWE